MKVPTLVSPRAKVVDDTANYSTFRPDPNAFGAGLGQAISGLGAALAAREEKTNRFTAITNFSEFETEAAAKLQEAQRAAPADGSGFARTTEDAYDKASEEFLNNKVPAPLREEFRARIAQNRQGIVGKALDFQYKQGDAYFKQGIAKQYEAARTALDPRLGGDPKNLEAQRAKLTEVIDASDLPEADKLDLKNRMNSGLESVGYRAAVAENVRAPYDKIPSSVGQIIDSAATRYGQDPATLRRIAYLESGGDPNAQNPNSSAGGLFQFIDTTAKSYGVANKMDAGQSADGAARLLRDNRAGLLKVLGREPTVGELYLAHQQGLGGASRLLAHPNEKATRILGPNAVKLNGGNADMTAQEFANMWIRKAEGVGDLDNNPAFANVPYESRLSLREDATRDAVAEATQEAKAKKAQYDAQLNGLLTSIHDGVAGQTDIDAFRAKHPGTDYGDISKMDEALKKYSEGVGLAATGQAMLDAGRTFDPTDTNDKKRVNAMVGNSGLTSLQEQDKDYVTSNLIPLVSGTGMIPTDVSGLLSGMVRGNNAQKALFALNTLQQMADANPRAFAQLPEDLQKDVDLWNRRAGKAPDEEILKALNPGTSLEQRNADKELRKQATDILSTKTNKVPTIDTLVQDFVGKNDSWLPFTGSTSAGAIPWAAQALYSEFQTEFTDAYVKTGNVEDATDAATKALSKRWAVTSVGNKTLMRNPPESVYQPYRGGYDWISEQVRKENKLAEGSQFQLISDDTTNQEVQAFRAGTLDRPPSYKIAAYENGVWKEIPGRQWFKVEEADKITDRILFDKDVEIKRAEQEVMDLEKAVTKNQPGLFNVAPDDAQELNDDFNAAMDRLNKLKGERETLGNKPVDYTPLNTNPMGDMF